MRRSIDDRPFDPGDYPPHYEEEELTPVGWAVAISDDYGDARPRVIITVEELGRPGQGLVGHLTPDVARRLRVALRDGSPLASGGRPGPVRAGPVPRR